MHDSSRIDALEIKLAHVELALSELNDAVIRQQKELDQALARQQRLRDQLAALEMDASAGAPEDEKPPHY